MKTKMKNQISFLRWFIVLFLAANASVVMAQTSQTPTQTVCISTQPYLVDVSPIPGATYNWNITPGTIGIDWNINGTGNAITIDWLVAGVYQLSVYTSANNCDGTPQIVDVTVVDQPIGPTLAAMTPAGPNVCEGTDVSATFNAGTGGVGCSDEFEYSYDNSGTWVAYNPGDLLTTTGHTLVEIRGRRAGCTADMGCTSTAWVTLASWTVNPALTVTVTITASVEPVCDGTQVTYSAAATNGGTTPTYNWLVNGIAVGVTTDTYAYIPFAGDIITCEVTSSESCASPIPAIGTFTPTVNPVPATSPIYHN